MPIPRALAVVLFGSFLLVGQSARDEWRHLQEVIDAEQGTDTLANAHLSGSERDAIVSVLDGPEFRERFYAGQRDNGRSVILNARVGFLSLTEGKERQILIRGPRATCGATGNCPMWIFARENGSLRLILQPEGRGLIVSKTVTKGYYGITSIWHLGARETSFQVFRWDGRVYAAVDCYSAKLSDGMESAQLESCPKPAAH